ncbi:MAG: CDC27 family protein [Gammaproteobacteria bacterium]|jgi:tetratricopeptide (TPR) repeat protein
MNTTTIEEQFEAAVSLYLDGQYASAETLCRDLLRIASLQPAIHHVLSLICFHLGKINDALTHAEAAVLLEPRSIDHLSNLGDIHQARFDHNKANACYKAADTLALLMTNLPSAE